jgi:hypothetical protein
MSNIYDGSFTHANTALGTITDTALVGTANAWVDQNTAWQIISNLLHGAGSSQVQNDFLTRPTGESTGDQTEFIYTAGGGATAAGFYNIVVRWTHGGTLGTSTFYMAEWVPAGGGPLTIFKGGGGSVANLHGPDVYNQVAGHQYKIGLSASGSSPVVLTFTIFDITANALVYTQQASDSTSPLTTGVCGVTLNGTTDISRVQTYNSVTSPSESFTISPSSIPVNATTAVTLTGTGTTFTSATFSVSGNGATIFSHSASSDTSAILNITTEGIGGTVGISDGISTTNVTVPQLPTFNIVFVGDSRTWGTNASSGSGTVTGTVYPAITTLALGAGATGHNVGVAGQNLGVGGSSAIALYASVVAPLYDSSKTYNIVVLSEGINDIRLGSSNAAAVIADTKTYAALCKATGFLFVLLPIEPGTAFSLPVSPDPIISQVNASFATTWRTFADGYGDYSLDPRIGVPGCQYNTTYFSAVDSLHETDAGYAAKAQYALAGIQAAIHKGGSSGGVTFYSRGIKTGGTL